MLKVGLTGGIGGGKSTASSYFESLGAFIFDGDVEAKNLIDENKIVQAELISEFGTDIIDGANNIDKKKLARVAFQDDNHQQRLNSVVHPHVYEAIDLSFNKIFDKKEHKLFILDAAMIYESGYDAHLDYVIVVTALIKNRMERALSRKTLSREEILSRIDFQWPEEEKVDIADFVINNDGTEDDLKNHVDTIYSKLV